MRYIFEDHSNSNLGILMRAGYEWDVLYKLLQDSKSSKDIVLRSMIQNSGVLNKPKNNQLEFVSGNGNISGRVTDILNTTAEDVFVMFDMIPGGMEEREMYFDFQKIIHRYPDRLFVLPIPCSEYYAIKAFKDAGVIIEKYRSDVEACINREWYANSSIFNTKNGIKTVKNFEKYCKHVMRVAFKDCASFDSTDTASNPDKNRIFYNKACFCTFGSEDECHELSMIDKIIMLLSSYPCVPSGSILKRTASTTNQSYNVRQIFKQEFVKIHKQLVDDYNVMCSDFDVRDPNKNKKYRQVAYLYN